MNIFQCSIDLHGNVLRIGTTGTETPFLAEQDLPECARLSTFSEEEIMKQSARQAEEQDLQRAIANSRGTNSKKKIIYNFFGK